MSDTSASILNPGRDAPTRGSSTIVHVNNRITVVTVNELVTVMTLPTWVEIRFESSAPAA